MSPFRDYGAFDKHKKEKRQPDTIKSLKDQRQSKFCEVDLVIDSFFLT